MDQFADAVFIVAIVDGKCERDMAVAVLHPCLRFAFINAAVLDNLIRVARLNEALQPLLHLGTRNDIRQQAGKAQSVLCGVEYQFKDSVVVPAQPVLYVQGDRVSYGRSKL